jgi:hypothetical protein
MAKVRLNPTVEAIQGAIGDLVYKTYNRSSKTSGAASSAVMPPAGSWAHCPLGALS